MLPSVLQQIHAKFPALCGQCETQPSVQLDLAAQLMSDWKKRQPAAGKMYWTARSWGMLMWQPAYLNVIASYLSRSTFELTHLRQTVVDGFTTGYTLPESALQHGAGEELIRTAASALRQYHQQHLQQLCELERFSAKQAACLTVDCVLSALLWVQQYLGWSYTQLNAAAEQWLSALEWQKHGQLMPIEMPGSACSAALNRQGCCQHFRLPGEQACSTCPRWPMAERIEKIKLELMNT
ncbi:siderophore ferric iron reductase [Chitinibacter sp. SCUT-21]|uniref:siderophore ferric iron reductase n=1 Tax=Chitinibacter sp. SCUT-21 TaxID=2970891 RepID=UPI0035A6BFF3